MTTTPVLYRLDDDGEAYDVIWLCSTQCRATYLSHVCDESARLAEGDDDGAIEGTKCEMCGKVVSL